MRVWTPATERGHVIYESWLELARLLFADFDTSVTRIFAQPFLFSAQVEATVRRHVVSIHGSGCFRVGQGLCQCAGCSRYARFKAAMSLAGFGLPGVGRVRWR